jgi:hypothetical protein
MEAYSAVCLERGLQSVPNVDLGRVIEARVLAACVHVCACVAYAHLCL